MKLIKILLWLLLVVIVIASVIGLINKGPYSISRNITVKATKSAVWDNINSFKKMDKWSPWNSLDTAMVKTWPTEDGKVGAKYSWVGNSNVGKGSQTILYTAADDSIATDLVFTEPFEATSTIGIKISGTDGNVVVTQTITGTHGFIDGIMGGLFGNKMMRDKFDEGLASLKKICESAPSNLTTANYSVNEVEFPGMEVAATFEQGKLFKTITPDWFSNQFKMIGEYIGKNKLVSKNHAYLITKNHTEKPEPKGDCYAAMDIDKSVPADGKVSCYSHPKAKALKVSYFGKYEEMMPAYEAIMKYAADKKLNPDYSIEHYITDPATVNGDWSKVQTDIWMILK